MRKYSINIITAALVLLSIGAVAQCGMYEVSLSDRVVGSDLIVEGKVVNSQSVYNSNQTLIYTAYAIEVYKVFKGNLPFNANLLKGTPRQVTLVTEGGQIGMNLHVVNPSLKVEKNRIGVFFLQHSNVNASVNLAIGETSNTLYDPVGITQGIIRYDIKSNVAADVYHTYASVPTMYTQLAAATGVPYQELQTFDIYQVGLPTNANEVPPVITTISPDTVRSGEFDTVTVTGSNFGASFSGSAAFEFRNPDDGGATFLSVDTLHVVSWSDALIKVLVPGNGNKEGTPMGAGTGTIRITNTGGESTTSSTDSIVVYFATANLFFRHALDTAFEVTHYVDSNAMGGYTFQYNTQFNDSTAAVAAFERSLLQWRHCSGSKVNVGISSTTTATTCEGDDGVNVVAWDNVCNVSPALGRGYTYYGACWTGSNFHWNLKGIDIVFDINATWNFGPAAPSGGENDFESVSNHELGHCLSLGHVIKSGRMMHYSITTGTMNRVIGSEDTAAVNVITGRSISSPACGATAYSLGSDTAKWTGATSVDWHNKANWNINMVPDSCNIVYIPGKVIASTQPTISTTGNRVLELLIAASDTANVTITTGSLDVKKP